MQIPEAPLPPLAPLWDRVLRAQTLPPDVDANLLHTAIKDRLTHPEWEVRLNALRVLADLLPLSGSALEFPLDQVTENLGHSSPNVRKAALDALKIFCTHCDDPEYIARVILKKCSYENIRVYPNDTDSKINVMTGLILSIPSILSILKKRCSELELSTAFHILGKKLLDHYHRDVAWRSLVKLRRICEPREYMMYISELDQVIQDKFHLLCDVYDEDSLDVYYGPRKVTSVEIQSKQLIKASDILNSSMTSPIRISTDSSSDDSIQNLHFYHNFSKVIIETEIKFDSDTAITMTVLEENETESEGTNIISDDDRDSTDQNTLKYSDSTDNDSEDTDVIVKKVRFGGESVKIRTPDSENHFTSEDDSNNRVDKDENVKASAKLTPPIVEKASIVKSEVKQVGTYQAPTKRSSIPLPVIPAKNLPTPTKLATANSNEQKYKMKQKSKSMNELYDYFRTKSKQIDSDKAGSNLTLTIPESRTSEKARSPVEPHREVEVLHNLQRSPIASPRRRLSRSLSDDESSMIHHALSRYPQEHGLKYPRPISPLRFHYEWEDYGLLPNRAIELLHDTDNWVATVKATDQLHNVLLEEDMIAKIEHVAHSLVQHMWTLSTEVVAAKASAEGAVCALFSNASNDCARKLLPALVSRLGSEPGPAALPHVLLQRVNLRTLIELIFDPSVIQVENGSNKYQIRAALCLARAAGPAAVMSAVRAHFTESEQADEFCSELRESLNKPLKNATKQGHFARVSHLPVPIRSRAKSTPSAAVTVPRNLRPLSDSAPLNGAAKSTTDITLKLPQGEKANQIRRSTSLVSPRVPLRNGINDKEFNKVENASPIVNNDSKVYTKVSVTEENPSAKTPPKSPSIKVQDFSDRSEQSLNIVDDLTADESDNGAYLEETEILSINQSVESFQSQESIHEKNDFASGTNTRTDPELSPKKRSLRSTPEHSDIRLCERDVRTALNECLVPAKHDDWEVIVNSLSEIERLSNDSSATAPAASWRAVVRSVANHVCSLRSRVARTACRTLGSLFEHHGKVLDPELDEAIGALLERCADVNRFIRVDAADALVQIARGGSNARVAVALARRGSTHRAGPVRAAATRALANLVQHHGEAKVLDMPQESRTILLRAVADLLVDAHPETRQQARILCMALAEDSRFRPLLQESIPVTSYRNVVKHMEKLHIL